MASVCLASLIAGGAAFAQDAATEQAAVEEAVAEDVVTGEVVTEEVVIDEAVAEEPVAEAEVPQPEAVAEIPPLPEAAKLSRDQEKEIREYFKSASDEELAQHISHLSEIVSHLEEFGGVGSEFYHDYKSVLKLAQAEMQRRTAPEPSRTEGADLTVTQNGTPPAGYCENLAASGNRADCGWHYRVNN